MFEKHTDLALESHEIKAEKGIDDGIILTKKVIGGITVTYAEIKNDIGKEIAGKPEGKYITVDIGDGWRYEKEDLKNAAKVISAEIKSLLPKTEGTKLIVGLGNMNITPDSIGPRVLENIIVTRHIKNSDPFLFCGAGFGDVAAIAPGVLAQTGIESAEIIKSVCESIKPGCVIIIDSLASRKAKRIATTVQITDSGIKPGSGVFNSRAALTKEFLDSPVISLGVPTVVDAATLAHDVIEESFGECPKDFEDTLSKIFSGEAKGKFVVPKEIDVIAEDTSKLLALSLNMALHGMDISEAEVYLK